MIVEYFIVTAEDVTRGLMRVPVAREDRLRLRHIWEAFPFEGQFHFRAKLTRGDAPFVWLDLKDGEDRVPLVQDGAAVIKVTPLFDVQDAIEKSAPKVEWTPQGVRDRESGRVRPRSRISLLHYTSYNRYDAVGPLPLVCGGENRAAPTGTR